MTPWSPRFETGHPAIDQEHREIFQQLISLKEAVDGGAGRERIVELIVILQHYALEHFGREETHMHRVGCPAFAVNCEAHAAFARKLEGWLSLLTHSGTPVSLMLDVHREATAWIESHIANVDCQLRGCARVDPEAGAVGRAAAQPAAENPGLQARPSR